MVLYLNWDPGYKNELKMVHYRMSEACHAEDEYARMF